MPVIKLETKIKAVKAVVFDLARNIDLHQISAKQTKEKAIAGKISGLIELNESVTWRAKYFGVYHTLSVKITKYNKPHHFTDEMISGIFKSFIHEHHFKEEAGITIMIDVFDYKAPLGFIGSIIDILFLKRYMTKFLSKRNQVIKEYAEKGLS